MSLRSGSAGDGETARHGEDVLEYEPFIPGTAPDPPSSFMKPKKKEYIVKDPKMKIPCSVKMMPPSIVGAHVKYQESRRHDVSMYNYKNLSWEFMEALVNSEPAQIAKKEGFTSTAFEDKFGNVDSDNDRQIDIYLKRTAVNHSKRHHVHQKTCPEPFKTLITLQDRGTGTWKNLYSTKKCLRISEFAPEVKDRVMDCREDWQEATAIAVAAIRQRYELFEFLGDCYDLVPIGSGPHCVSEEMIAAGREIVIEYTDPIEEEINPEDHEARQRKLLRSRQEKEREALEAKKVKEREEKKKQEEEEKKKARFAMYENDNGDNSHDLTVDTTEDGLAAMPESSPSKTPGFAERLRSITPQVDKRAVEKMKDTLEACQLDVIEQFMDMEKYRNEIIDCLTRSLRAYHAADVHAERNLTLLEFTARIGDGYKAQLGFDDWRGTGVRGYRPMVIKFLNGIHHLAHLRLELAELLNPIGRKVRERPKEMDPAIWRKKALEIQVRERMSDWSLIWDGEDLVHKVLHSLDFLRKSPELYNWYGRTYWFIANPLALAFNYKDAIDGLDMREKVNEWLMTEAHFRQVKILPDNWQYSKYLSSWAAKFGELSSGRWECWPNLPRLVEFEEQEPLYISLLVLMIKCTDVLEVCAASEKKMVGQLSTARGLEFYFEGAVKPPKATTLELPFRVNSKYIDPYSDSHPRNIAAEASRLALLQKHGQVKRQVEASNKPKKMLVMLPRPIKKREDKLRVAIDKIEKSELAPVGAVKVKRKKKKSPLKEATELDGKSVAEYMSDKNSQTTANDDASKTLSIKTSDLVAEEKARKETSQEKHDAKDGVPPKAKGKKGKGVVERSEILDRGRLANEGSESRRVTRAPKTDTRLTKKTVVDDERGRGVGASKPLKAEGVILAPIKRAVASTH